MAFSNETVTKAKIGVGPVIVTFGSPSEYLARVIDFEIETTPGKFEIMGGSEQQIIDIIRTSKGTGKIRLTLDEVDDIDAIDGEHENFCISQEFPKGTTANWALTNEETVDISVLSTSGNRNAAATVVKIEVTPMADVGSDAWTFDDAVDNS